MKKLRRTKHRGFLLAELLFALFIFSIVLTISVQPLSQAPFKERARDVAFMNQLKGAIVNQRFRAVREPGVGYNFVLSSDGSVLFSRQTSTYLILNDPDYRVYIQKGARTKVFAMSDFRNVTEQGTSGFTITIEKRGKLMDKLIFQVVTSSFREEFYGN